MTNTVGVVGLGVMGSGMAQHLSEEGFSVLAYDPAPGAVERQEFPVEAMSVEDLARTADYLLLSVPGSAQVEDVMATVLTYARPGLVVVDTSTSDPQVTRRMAAKAAEAGVLFVDAPVSGGRTGALNGTLRSFVGGSKEAIAKAGPLIQALTAGRAVFVGGPGAGHIVKLLNNAMVAAHLAIAGEALAIADAFELDPETVLNAINGATGRSGVTEVNVPTWVMSGTFDSGFTMGLMSRDVALATEVGAAAGAPVPLLSLTADRWGSMLAQAGAGADFNESVRLIRESASASVAS